MDVASSPHEAFSNAARYYDNAKENLRKSPVKYGIYLDSKYVREDSAMAYIAALAAVDEALMKTGVRPKNCPSRWKDISSP